MCKTDLSKARFKDFDDNEESTQMESITYIEPSYLKRYTIVPLLGICTAFIFLVCLYNSLPLRKKWLYLESTRQRATHLYIVGKRKCILSHQHMFSTAINYKPHMIGRIIQSLFYNYDQLMLIFL